MGKGSVSTSLQASYILHYTEWRESSLIVDAFTLEHGRISLMARSARTSRSRTRALYQPFRPLLLSWVGRSDLRTLTGIEEAGAVLELTGAELACGYYVNELILRLLGKDQVQPEIFAHYVLALSDLSSADTPGTPSMEAVLRIFELQLLDGLAVLPDLARCTPDGTPVDPALEYDYFPFNAVAIPRMRSSNHVRPGIPKTGRLPGSGDSREPSVHADGMTRDEPVPVIGRTLLALASLELDEPTVLQQARPLMRQILRVHLGDRPLRSRELFESLASSGRSQA